MIDLVIAWMGPVACAALVAWLVWAPRVRAVAGNTFREAVRRPVVLLVTLGAAAVLVLLGTVPLFATLPREEVSLAIDLGISTVMLTGLVVAVFSAGGVVTDEIDNRTALVVLSKGISRWQFLLGKYLGVTAVVWLVVGVLGVACQAGTFWKFSSAYELTGSFGAQLTRYLHLGPSMGFAELGQVPMDQVSATPVGQGFFMVVTLGTLACLGASAIVTALALAVSTRAPIAVTALVCLGGYTLGHLADFLARPDAEAGVVGRLTRWLVPNLGFYDLTHTLTRGRSVPTVVLGMTLTYTVLVSAALLVVGHLLLRRRDVS